MRSRLKWPPPTCASAPASRGRSGWTLSIWASGRALVVTDPNLARTRACADGARGARGRGCRGGAVRPGARRADRPVVPRRHSVRRVVCSRRARGGGRRVGHRHGQGGESLHDLSPGGLPRLRQRADREGDARAGSAQAAHRHSYDRRDRQRDDGRQHLRPHRAAREDRDCQPTAQADAGPAGSRQHADDAAGGGGVERARHPEPRHRVVHGAAVYLASPARESVAASGLPGVESNQRHLGAAGAANGRAVPRPGRRGSRPTTKHASR